MDGLKVPKWIVSTFEIANVNGLKMDGLSYPNPNFKATLTLIYKFDPFGPFSFIFLDHSLKILETVQFHSLGPSSFCLSTVYYHFLRSSSFSFGPSTFGF